MMGVIVSADLIVEILAKLPAKSLLRFHCVSKTWYSFISDPQFSNNLHQRRPSVLICDELREFSTITIESLLRIKDRALTPLSLPWETNLGKNTCLGSCNSLVCVSHTSPSSDLIIWNPSTRKFRRLPRPIGSIKHSLWTFAWFGYDEWIEDYKLVWLNFSDVQDHPKVAELNVFTLKSNSWRRSSVDHIAVVVLNLVDPDTGVLSNGSIYWIAEKDFRDVCILALDLVTEKLRVLEFPHAPLNVVSRVGSLEGGCLCLCTDSYGDDGFILGRDLWVMKEYGFDSSWTKLLSILFDLVYPILLSKEGKEMVAIRTRDNYDEGRIVKLRVEEEGGKEVKRHCCVLLDILLPVMLSYTWRRVWFLFFLPINEYFTFMVKFFLLPNQHSCHQFSNSKGNDSLDALAFAYALCDQMDKTVETSKKAISVSKSGWKSGVYTIAHCLKYLECQEGDECSCLHGSVMI